MKNKERKVLADMERRICLCAVYTSVVIAVGTISGCGGRSPSEERQIFDKNTEKVLTEDSFAEVSVENMSDEAGNAVAGDDGTVTDRDATVMLTVGGEKETEFPATLHTGGGYGLYVTDGDWVMFAPNSWYAEKDEQVRFWIGCYAGLSTAQVERILKAQGYLGEKGTLQKEEGGTLYQVQCFETESDVWTMRSVYPATPEYEESWGELLRVMSDTFVPEGDYDADAAATKAVMPEGEQLQLYEAVYVDETSRAWALQDPDYTGIYVYDELIISNVTKDSFHFTVVRRNYETGESETIIPLSLAAIREDGNSAVCEGADFTLTFDFSDRANPLPTVLTIGLWGVDSLEGIRFTSDDIPGYEAG